MEGNLVQSLNAPTRTEKKPELKNYDFEELEKKDSLEDARFQTLREIHLQDFSHRIDLSNNQAALPFDSSSNLCKSTIVNEALSTPIKMSRTAPEDETLSNISLLQKQLHSHHSIAHLPLNTSADISVEPVYSIETKKSFLHDLASTSTHSLVSEINRPASSAPFSILSFFPPPSTSDSPTSFALPPEGSDLSEKVTISVNKSQSRKKRLILLF
ncbi:unnamed protein product [Protopolystoma xenopodis]|uniref:Uncharacterized protein n=1 Tax=Protopolystoma xenopodis TaxID=117903 RepID=A0A3S5CQP4_9PLAT|nr:unnamed protein product [Protopolystoma xenopodis]